MFMPHATTFGPSDAMAGLALGLQPDAAAAGILAATLVETDTGWRPAGTILRGTRVATHDGGFRPVSRVERRHVWPGAGGEVVRVPGGTLGACSDLVLLPGQEMLILSAIAEDVLDAAGVLVRAGDLVGHFGIERHEVTQPLQILSLGFDEEEIVYANSGALIHCGVMPGGPGFYPRLDRGRAAAMLDLIAGGAVRSDALCAAA